MVPSLSWSGAVSMSVEIPLARARHSCMAGLFISSLHNAGVEGERMKARAKRKRIHAHDGWSLL